MASKRRIRRKQCEGKKRYSDKEECEYTMRKVRKKNPSWQRLNTYKCKFCKGWHFGHTPKKVIKQIKGRKSATKDITDYKKFLSSLKIKFIDRIDLV